MKEKAIEFAKTINNSIDEEIDFAVKEDLAMKRVRKVKRLPGEEASHEPILDAWDNFKVNQFLIVMDTTIQTLTNRFSSSQNTELIEEMSYFLPTKFDSFQRQSSGVKFPALSRVLKVDSKLLFQELDHFATNFISLLKVDEVFDSVENLILSDDGVEEDVERDESEIDDVDESEAKCLFKKKPCSKCLKCCFLLLSKLNLHVSTYSNLYRAYEFFMTLPCTQVECERTFSKLRILKSRLRSALQQQLLEPLLFMFVHREMTFNLNLDALVKIFGRSSVELRKLLIG